MSILSRWFARAIALMVLLSWFWASPVWADSETIVWRRADGPWGGTIRALAIDPQKPNVVYAGTTCGVYRSDDSGQNWKQVGKDAISCRDIRLLAIDLTHSQTLYAAGSQGFYRTEDRGDSWTRIDRGFTGQTVSALALNPSLPGALHIAVQGSVWTSLDYGRHWKAHDAPFRGEIVWTLAVDAVDPRRLYAGTHRGLYLSTDSGANWEMAKSVPQISVRGLASDLADPHHLYIATDQGLWASPDSGVTWQTLDGARALPTSAIVVHPGHGGALWAIQGSRTVVRSTDQGRTWKPLLSLASSQLALTMAVDPYDPQRLFVGTTRGLYVSADGGLTWDLSIGGIAANEIKQIVDIPGTKGQVYVVTPDGIMETTDGGQTWQGRNRGLAETNVLALSVDPRDHRVLYCITASGDVWRSQDGGAQWALTEQSLPSGSQANRLLVWRPSNADPILYAATENTGVLHSLDHGDHWEALGTGLPAGPVRGMVLVYGRVDWIYVGAGADIYRLAIDAQPPMEWQRTTSEPLNGQVTDIHALSHPRQTLYASTEAGGVFRQRQENAQWENLSREILPFSVPARALWVSSRPWQSPLLWVITDAGLFSSQDEGSTWSLANLDSLQQGNVRCLTTDDRGPGDLYVGTARSGLYYGQPTTTPIISSVGYLLLAVVAFGGLAGLFKGRDMLHRYWQSRHRLLLQQNWGAWNAMIDNVLASHDIVTPNMLEQIPSDSRLIAMRGYVRNRQDQALLYKEQPPTIEPQRLGELANLNTQWSSLLQTVDKPSEAIPIATHLTEQACELLGFEPLVGRAFRSLFGYLVHAPTLRLGVPSRFPIIFVLRLEMRSTDIQDIRDLMTVFRVTSFFALLVTLDGTPAGKEHARSLVAAASGGADDLIVLSYDDLRNLHLASDTRRRLVETILEQADLTLVSPYIVSGPVPDNMFFGRDYEIKAIMRTIQDRNYAILGGRKIGKTSVLTKLHRLLEQTSGFRAYYLDCEHIFDHSQFLASLALACQPAGTPTSIDDIRHLAVCLRRQWEGRAIVFLLDEVDHLLTYDRQNQDRLFSLLRALTIEGLCRFVFCGERVLHRALHDRKHPLPALVSTIELGYLSQQDALRIVAEPMDAMGIAFEKGTRLPERIVALSSGHPNLVQAVCHMLIERMNKRGDRIVSERDLSEVKESEQFRDFVLEVMWGDASTVGRLITLLMARSPVFTLDDARSALQSYGYQASMADLKEALDELALLSVLRQRGDQYAFIARAFTEIMSESEVRESFSETLWEELRDGQPRSFSDSLQAQPPQSKSGEAGQTRQQ